MVSARKAVIYLGGDAEACKKVEPVVAGFADSCITFGPFGNYVDVWEATTLATVGQLAPHGALFDFVVGPDALYTSETRTDPRALSRAGRVVRYDLSTLAPLQSWDFAVMPQGIALSGDGASVYAFGDIETWIVPVH